MKFISHGLLILVSTISLYLGYKTEQIVSRKNPAPSHEIIVEMEAPPAPSFSHSNNPSSPRAIYETYCAACHETGAAGSPKRGDLAAWATRLGKGTPLLLQHVVQGYNLMPPKGTCLQCSETELKATVEYLTEKSR